MSTRKERKDSLDWKLPIFEQLKLTDRKFTMIVEQLPSYIYLTEPKKSQLRKQIEEARNEAKEKSGLSQSASTAALQDRLSTIQKKTLELIKLLSVATRDKALVAPHAEFSKPNSRRVLNHKIEDALAEIAAPELGHDDHRIQRLQNVFKEAPTYRPLQGILDDLLLLEKWTKAAVVQNQQSERSKAGQQRNLERNAFLNSISKIWLALKSNSSIARNRSPSSLDDDLNRFAITVAKQFGWKVSAKVVKDVIGS